MSDEGDVLAEIRDELAAMKEEVANLTKGLQELAAILRATYGKSKE